jgi:hypothetical protein
MNFPDVPSLVALSMIPIAFSTPSSTDIGAEAIPDDVAA